MKKTLVSLLLVLVMVLGMFAGTGAVAEDVGYPEEITIFTGLTEHLSKIGVTNYNETVFWQELEKRTGTHVEFEHLPAGADMMAQVNLMVASNDLPDIINGVNWKTVPDGANIWEEDGVIIDLTELIPVYMPNYYAAIMELPFSIAELSIGGKMYYISDIQHGVPFEGPNIREDWLKAAGMETPTTVDELYDVLVYFRDNDMNGDGDATNEWPMSGLGATSIGWSPLNLMWAWGVHYSYQLVDGQVTHGMLLPEFAEAIGTVAKFYAEGLLDPDYSTQDRTALDGKYMNHLVGMEYGIQPTKMNNALNKEAVEGQFKAGSVPNLKLTADSPSYVFDTMYISLLKGASAAITGACEEPEKVLHWFDYIYSPEGSLLFNWGIEGESFAYDDGANDWTILTRIMIPLALPVIAVIALYIIVANWNSYIAATIYLRDRALYPLQVILREILISGSSNLDTATSGYDDFSAYSEAVKYATIIASTLPVLCIYPFLQRFFVKGVMLGAIKG